MSSPPAGYEPKRFLPKLVPPQQELVLEYKVPTTTEDISGLWRHLREITTTKYALPAVGSVNAHKYIASKLQLGWQCVRNWNFMFPHDIFQISRAIDVLGFEIYLVIRRKKGE